MNSRNIVGDVPGTVGVKLARASGLVWFVGLHFLKNPS